MGRPVRLPELPTSPGISAAQPESLIELVRGRDRILSLHAVLLQLAALSGQVSDAEDLAYFLSTPDALKKDAVLLLVRASVSEAAVMGFSGAVLLFEYRLPMRAGGSRVYCSADLTGRRTVFAARQRRPRVAAQAVRFLMDQASAQIVHIAFQQTAEDTGSELAMREALEATPQIQGAASWTLAERRVPLYLPLEATFDGTLARIGQRTRSNLRYYRRRTERDLGCTFVQNVQMTLEEFVAFNRECMYAVPDALARWRYRSLEVVNRPLFAGIRDGNGRWLAIVGGRRRTREIEIDWQMNRNGLLLYSLSTVLRACLIEDEIGRGSTRLYIEGGTPQFIGRSFVEETVVELTVQRRSWYSWVLKRLARRLFPAKNYVAQILRDSTQRWHDL